MSTTLQPVFTEVELALHNFGIHCRKKRFSASSQNFETKDGFPVTLRSLF